MVECSSVGWGASTLCEAATDLTPEVLIWLAIMGIILLFVYPRNRPAGVLVFAGMGVALFTMGETSGLILTSAYATFAITGVMLVETAMNFFNKNKEDKKAFKGW